MIKDQEEEAQDSSFEEEQIQEGLEEEEVSEVHEPKRRRLRKGKQENSGDEDSLKEEEDIYDDNYIVDKLPEEKDKLRQLLYLVEGKLKNYKRQFLKEQQQKKVKKSMVGDNAVPICADVTKFNFDLLIQKQLNFSQRLFDVIMMDPPWKLSTSQPSRGVAIQYCSLTDEVIENLPIPKLQNQGFLFVWVINAKYQFTVNAMQKKWGYKVIDIINWVKKTVNGKIAKGHGFYLQHAKESCLVGYKGNFKNFQPNQAQDVIWSERRGQSQKPTQIYEYIQKLVPNGYCLQIFGRRNNLRKNWVTIGNQL